MFIKDVRERLICRMGNGHCGCGNDIETPIIKMIDSKYTSEEVIVSFRRAIGWLESDEIEYIQKLYRKYSCTLTIEEKKQAIVDALKHMSKAFQELTQLLNTTESFSELFNDASSRCENEYPFNTDLDQLSFMVSDYVEDMVEELSKK